MNNELENFAQDFGDRLKWLRRYRRMTQAEMAKVLGIDKSALSRFEKAERQPSVDLLVRLAFVYHVSLDFLCTGYRTRDVPTDLWDHFVHKHRKLVHVRPPPATTPRDPEA